MSATCRTPRRALSAAGILLACALGGLGSAPEARAADVIERVVAVVNDEAIFMSDVRRRAAPFLSQVMATASQRERLALLERLYGQMTDLLIDEELIRQAAQRMQIRVSTADVNRAIENVRGQNQLSEPEFWEAVRSQGYTEAQYRSDLRRQLLRLKVINTRVRGRVNITEEDVRREYDQAARRANRQYRFRASHVFLPLSANASATEVAEVRTRAEAIRAQTTPETFADAIAAHGGGELGWLSQGDLPRELENPLLTVAPGTIGAPVRGPSGFHVFFLHERETAASDVPTYDEMKDEIYRRMLDEAMTRQEELFVQELRRDAIIARRE
ncbi:MAG: SurA N-terminal domain-containing protein [Polyangiaceae bacterium]|nr:SurA N-terminal domain-containing protein [Polyangiaceae bacterium]